MTIPGISMMHESFAVRLGILTHPVLYNLLISVKEVARYGWTMSTARVMKALLTGVRTMDGMYITADTVKMQESFVQVGMTFALHHIPVYLRYLSLTLKDE